MTALDAYQWMLRVCAIGLVIDGLEQIADRRRFADGELFAWRVLRRRLDLAPAVVRRLADALCAGVTPPMVVVALRLAAVATVVAAAPGSAPFAVGLTVLVATQLYQFLRRAGYGTFGVDQMNLVILGATWLAVVVDGSSTGLRLGLWFVAAQSCLSYGVNGVAKAASAGWRSGRAIPAAFATYTNGHPALHRVFATRPRAARLVAWLTIIWEGIFPIVLVVPDPIRLALLASGALFHITVAATMGVHLFVWAFVAPYAAIWAVTR